MAATAKKPSFMTAKGTASYPYLQPGRPDTQFDSEGIYKVQLMVDADQAKPMLEQLRSIANDEFGKDAKSANMPFKVDEETKKVIFTVKSRWSPKFVDASGKFIPEAACQLSSAASDSTSVPARSAPILLAAATASALR